MSEEYNESGGLRWGLNFWGAVTATWPFAHLRALPDSIQIRVSIFGIWSRVFEFSHQEIKSIRRKQVLGSEGIVINHTKAEYPPFVLFWSFRYPALKAALAKLGYAISDDAA